MRLHGTPDDTMPDQRTSTMRPIILTLLLLPLTAGAAWADDAADCTRRQVELAKQAAAFQGDTQIKRLIDADLQRARREQAEGDNDECVEALDHAAKLLAGGA